jgi:hypothetical protein
MRKLTVKAPQATLPETAEQFEGAITERHPLPSYWLAWVT